MKNSSSSRCRRCNKQLTRSTSVQQGYGPVCVHKKEEHELMSEMRRYADDISAGKFKTKGKSSIWLWKDNIEKLRKVKW